MPFFVPFFLVILIFYYATFLEYRKADKSNLTAKKKASKKYAIKMILVFVLMLAGGWVLSKFFPPY